MKTKTTRTIEISIKTDEFLVIKQRRSATRRWCAQCGKEVGMSPLQEFGESASVLQRFDGGRIHLQETSEGLLVCLNSLP